MGMTLWIHTLDGRKMSDESDDHSLMYDLAEELDVICSEAGKSPLSSFFDATDLEYNMSDEDPELDPETGLAYGIDDMNWFDPADGLATLKALRRHIADGWKPQMKEDRTVLIEELDDCISKLNELPATGKFHLAVVM